MIFDIKVEGKFPHKYILVACVHKTALISSITYSSVVTMGSVILAFIIAGMNNLDICACSIVNAYLNAPNWVKTVD